ncbi:putative U3 small nuclear ribonucleoprotein (snRNP) [Trypanosoma cruzi]|uniref:Putative U3 small nuclear ribonucleoprotein (SnRNP) n=1 Tax=Trypanosoma cruzi TaxID=5693 RepID=A0A2V2UFZ7_TRYCR|nr:putative U3 small nuclear ribonucleoprotein (snRNP) [Trypanosoma cruzi]
MRRSVIRLRKEFLERKQNERVHEAIHARKEQFREAVSNATPLPGTSPQGRVSPEEVRGAGRRPDEDTADQCGRRVRQRGCGRPARSRHDVTRAVTEAAGVCEGDSAGHSQRCSYEPRQPQRPSAHGCGAAGGSTPMLLCCRSRKASPIASPFRTCH